MSDRKAKKELHGHALAALCLTTLLWTAGADTPVADAAMRGEVEVVRTLLRQGADANTAQGDGMTALHWAAENGSVQITEMLVFAGANLEAVTRLGDYTALHLASKAGQGRTAETLLEAGADPNAVTSTGAAMPLHFAAAAGSAQTVTTLLDHGAIVDAKEAQWEQTPLMFAAAFNRVEALNTLLKRGADYTITAKVLDIAARAAEDRTDRTRRNTRMAALQAGERQGGGPPPSRGYADQRPDPREAQGTQAVAPGELPGLTPEAERETQLRSTDEIDPLSYADLVGTHGGLSALLLAVREGHLEAVRALLDAGADIDGVGAGDHTSPMLMAAVNGHFDLAKQLLEWGADPNLASDAGGTPLYAVLNMEWAPKARHPQPVDYRQQEMSYLQLMEILLDAGVDPNVRLKKNLWYTTYSRDLLGVDRTGATPFWRAAHATDVAAMRLLLRYGADPNIWTSKVPGRRRRGGAQEDLSGLPPVPVGGPAVSPIVAASGVGYGQGFAGNTHMHVPEGWLPTMRFLVEELGADVNSRDLNGYSPVHHAAARGDNELILYLVSQGADVTFVSRRGQTTVDMANGPVQRILPFPETIALLESLGAINNHHCVAC
jgi:ankyrin repeat protein